MRNRNLIFILLAISVSGCCKSHDKGEINFTTAERGVNPYNGHEILTFIDNNNDTIRYYGQSRDLTRDRREDGGCADCCVDFYNVESDKTTFTSSFLSSGFTIEMYFQGPIPPAANRNPNFGITWISHFQETNNVITSFTEFPVDNMQADAISAGLFKDSIYIRSKKFENVYIAVGHCGSADSIHGDTLFYTISQGIVGLKLSDGNLWVKE